MIEKLVSDYWLLTFPDKLFMSIALITAFIVGFALGGIGPEVPCSKAGYVYVVDTRACIPMNALRPAQ